MDKIRFTVYALLILVIGTYLCWVTPRRHSYPYVGWFGSRIQGSLHTNPDDPFFFGCSFTGASPRTWHWFRPSTFAYSSLDVHFHLPHGEPVEATVQLSDLSCRWEDELITLTPDLLVSLCFEMSQPTPLMRFVLRGDRHVREQLRSWTYSGPVLLESCSTSDPHCLRSMTSISGHLHGVQDSIRRSTLGFRCGSLGASSWLFDLHIGRHICLPSQWSQPGSALLRQT